MIEKSEAYAALREKESPALNEIAQLAIADAAFRADLLAGMMVKDDVYWENCFRALLHIAEEQPAVLYPEWNRFVEMLGSRNAFHRSMALQLIARLVAADPENRFDAVLDRYFNLLDDEKPLVARRAAQNAWRIARVSPQLRERVVVRLLDIDLTHHPQSRKDLIKADIVASFDTFFQDCSAQEQKEIQAFVGQQLNSASATTRQAAKAFMSAHPKR